MCLKMGIRSKWALDSHYWESNKECLMIVNNRLMNKFKKNLFKKFINYYAPFLGAGIKLDKMNADFTHAEVSMKLTLYNKNYVGTQFGGSLYSMIDPWYMLMLIENLGNNYIVWDKAAHIQFKKPGRGKVFAHFDLTQDQILEIKEKVKVHQKIDYQFKVIIFDKHHKTVAEVIKTLYIREKN